MSDKKIAIWLGWEHANGHWYANHNDQRKRRNLLPNWSTDDSIAIRLLPELVKRGYVNTELSYHNMHWWCKIQQVGYEKPVYFATHATIAGAISASLVKLIESI